MKKILFALLCVAGWMGIAHAGCTQEELLAKTQEFSTKVQQLAQKDSKKYQEVALAMQNDLPELQKNPQDSDKICAFYDKWNAKMK
jgi:uncharacterized pyridoxal phosphate-containing UPF0001 family protein